MLSNQVLESNTTETAEEKLDVLAAPIGDYTLRNGAFPDFKQSGFEDYNLYLSACIFLLHSGFFPKNSRENEDDTFEDIHLDFDLSKNINPSVFDELIEALNSGNCPDASVEFFINFAGYIDEEDKDKSYVEVGFDDKTGTVFSINSEVTKKIREVLHRGLCTSTSPNSVELMFSNYILNPETIATLGSLVLSSAMFDKLLFMQIDEELPHITTKFSYEKNWQADERFYNRYDSLVENINVLNAYRQSSLFKNLFKEYRDDKKLTSIGITSATLNWDSLSQKLSRNLSNTIKLDLHFYPAQTSFKPGQHNTESLKEHRKNLANAQQLLMKDDNNNSNLTETNVADTEETNNNSNSNSIHYAAENQDILFPNGKRKRQETTQGTQNNAAASNKPKHDSEKSQHKP